MRTFARDLKEHAWYSSGVKLKEFFLSLSLSLSLPLTERNCYSGVQTANYYSRYESTGAGKWLAMIVGQLIT